jgi:uncharacterized protein with NRDE domain
MCLIVVAFDAHRDYSLIVAANRDEFHSRPTQDAGWWADAPDIAGGRDLLAGGTWLAVHRNGRFAAVTNYRDAEPKHDKLRSRGFLVSDFLQSDAAPLDYLGSVDGTAYDGFNLLVGDRTELAYLSNQGDEPRQLPSGIYGLSNARLDSPCDKVQRSKDRLARLFAEERINDSELLGLLGDRDSAHAIMAPFIVMPEFGTRCSTLVTASRDGNWHLLEQRFDANGNKTGESRLEFSDPG